MAIQNLPLTRLGPTLDMLASSTFSGTSNFTLSAAGARAGWIMPAPATGTIDAIRCLWGSVTNNAAVTCGIYTVDSATGRPGTLIGSTVNMTPAASSMVKSSTGMGAAVTKGQSIAVIVNHGGGAGNAILARQRSSSGLTCIFPYLYDFDGTSTHTISAGTYRLALALDYGSDLSPPAPFLCPFSATALEAFQDSTNPDGRGVRFRLAAPVRVAGWDFSGNNAAGGADYTVSLRADDGTLLKGDDGSTDMTVDVDADIDSAVSGARFSTGQFPASRTLEANTWYRLMVRATGASNVELWTGTVPAAALLGHLFSTDFYYTTWNNGAGSFTDATDKVALIALLIDGIEAGGSGGAAGGQEDEMATVVKDSTNVTLAVTLRHATTGQGLTGLAHDTANLVAHYWRPGAAAPVEIPLVTQTVDGAHTDGGFVEIDATDMPGRYRLDLPDALAAAGVERAEVTLKGATNLRDCSLTVELVDRLDTTAGLVHADAKKIAGVEFEGGAVEGNPLVPAS